MAEHYTIQGVGKSFSKCRVHVRTFNNTIKDAQLGRIYKDVPCRVCEDQILNEGNGLHKECDRFIKHYKKHGILSLIAMGCCHARSNENNDIIHQDSKECIKEIMSTMRKFLRDYNDYLDDLNYKNEDGRPCEKCRESLVQECQGLTDELNKMNDQFQESSMKDKYPCDYAIACGDLAMRDGTRGKNKDRSNTKQQQPDSGFLSGGSEILGRAATESQDYSQAPSADIIFPNDPEKDVQTEMPSSSCNKADIEGPCVTLEGSMDDSNTKNA